MAAEERYVFHLAPHAEELAEQRHHDERDEVDEPPLPRARPAVVEDAAAEVDDVHRGGKVKALFGAFNHDGQEASAAVGESRHETDRGTAGASDGRGAHPAMALRKKAMIEIHPPVKDICIVLHDAGSRGRLKA